MTRALEQLGEANMPARNAKFRAGEPINYQM
jgi:hypothetical protein